MFALIRASRLARPPNGVFGAMHKILPPFTSTERWNSLTLPSLYFVVLFDISSRSLRVSLSAISETPQNPSMDVRIWSAILPGSDACA